jgi:hypothetical protein
VPQRDKDEGPEEFLQRSGQGSRHFKGSLAFAKFQQPVDLKAYALSDWKPAWDQPRRRPLRELKVKVVPTRGEAGRNLT